MGLMDAVPFFNTKTQDYKKANGGEKALAVLSPLSFGMEQGIKKTWHNGDGGQKTMSILSPISNLFA
jgi:hypothetical protein